MAKNEQILTQRMCVYQIDIFHILKNCIMDTHSLCPIRKMFDSY